MQHRGAAALGPMRKRLETTLRDSQWRMGVRWAFGGPRFVRARQQQTPHRTDRHRNDAQCPCIGSLSLRYLTDCTPALLYKLRESDSKPDSRF